VSGIARFRSMGCEVVVGLDRDAPVDALDRVRGLFAERDARFTRFAFGSELARVNRAGGPVLLSHDFARALRSALEAARQTGGLVDPTLLDALEGAGYDRDFAALDADERPARAGARGRWRELRVTGRLLDRPPGIRLDLNGVVKALAVDDALGVIGRAGWVSAGGDLAAGRPLDVALPRGGAVRLESGALATSGSVLRRWTRGGRWHHHLIDPRTGAPADSPWEQVTVCGATCWAADVAAKAAFLLGGDGPDWLDERDMPGRFVRADGRVVVNRGWTQMTGAGASREPACT
jgi:thiamine biosynthesis lipoprotein